MNNPTPSTASSLSNHQDEFTASAITADVIALNICEIGDVSYVAQDQAENEDLYALAEKLGLNDQRLNGGRLTASVLNRVRKYQGGWANLPFYGLADRQICNYFHFKPDHPDKDYKGRVIKYVGAQGVCSRLFTPNVPESNWEAIACRYNVEKTGDNFWEWVLDHPQIPVNIGEGFKKSLSGISANYLTAGISGCNGGYTSIKEDDGSSQGYELIPDLKALAKGGRIIYLALDRDTNGKTKRTVQQATKILASLLAEQECQVFSVKWDAHQYKGLDDFLAGAGVDAFELAIQKATDITPQPKQDKQKLPPPLEVAAVVAERLFNRLRYDASISQWWQYNEAGKWEPTYDVFVFKLVTEFLDQTLPPFLPSYVENVIKFARNSALVKNWQEASSLDFIPFTNGVLDLKTNQLLPHSPDYNFTWQLPRSYSLISTDWHRISDFLDVLTGFNKQLKAIAIAFCNAIIKGRADLQKFLYLFGSGANGKGSFMTLLRMLIGAENTHATTLKDLNENRFESANLKGKRLLLMTDEDKRLGGISVFKSVTGQDPIRYERKGRDSTNFTFEGVTIVAANSPTFVGDSNYALKRRKVDFPCLVKVEEFDRRDLVPEFTADLPAFTTYLLSLPDEWVTTIIRGAGSVEAVQKLNWELTMREDSIAAFLNERLIFDPQGSGLSGVIYKDYETFCDQNGLKPKSQTNFKPSLIELCTTNLGMKVSERRTTPGLLLEGLRLRTAADPYHENSKPASGEDNAGYAGSMLGTMSGLNVCLEPIMLGMLGCPNSLVKNEKNIQKEKENGEVENSYHQQENKKHDLVENSKTPNIPNIPNILDLEPLPSNGSIYVGLSFQPNITQHTQHESDLKIGDRVRYIGGMLKYRGQVGEITKVTGANFETTFTSRNYGSVTREDLERC